MHTLQSPYSQLTLALALAWHGWHDTSGHSRLSKLCDLEKYSVWNVNKTDVDVNERVRKCYACFVSLIINSTRT